MNDAQRRTAKKPVDWDDLFPGRFLKAGQLGDRKPTLTIKSVDLEALPSDDGGDRLKGVIAFKETPYEIALNKTNGLCLKAMFGRNVPDWIGKRITLFKGEWKKEPAVRIWGSPDIREDFTVPIKLPRRGTQHMTMHKTEARAPKQGEIAPAEQKPEGAGGERPVGG